MSESVLTPQVVGQEDAHVERLLDTDLTPSERARVEGLELKLKQSDATIIEQYILQGEVLFTIQQECLYRSRDAGERFTWEEYLDRFTPLLTRNGRGFKMDAANNRLPGSEHRGGKA